MQRAGGGAGLVSGAEKAYSYQEWSNPRRETWTGAQGVNFGRGTGRGGVQTGLPQGAELRVGAGEGRRLGSYIQNGGCLPSALGSG